ncbi:MAG: hypothetical protein IKF64_02940 [Eubacterium sp.]|nr:hypothetical protein [Eubacterium sp.]
MRSKTRFSKKVLSIFLSAIMVVTMLPTFAITASANAVDANEHLVGQYLVDGLPTANVADTNGVTWYSNKNEAQFNGGSDSYIKLNENPFYGKVDSTTGFTISFDFFKEDGIDGWARFFEISDGDTTNKRNCHAIVAGDTDYRSLALLLKTNGTEYGYWPAADVEGNPSYYTYSYGGNMGGQKNAWHNLTVSMDTSGNYYCYLDNVLRAQASSSYNLKNIDTAALLNSFGTYTKLWFGADVYGDQTFKGYMKNVRFFNASYNNLTDAEKLLILMGEYESKMNGATYTNMEAAYKAYVDANEAYDAAVYGNSNTAQVSTAYTNLKNAIDAMTEWNGYTGTFAPTQGTFNGDSQGASYYAGHYNNLLYLPTGQKSHSNYGDKDWLRIALSTPSRVVALYDGVNIAKYPAMPFVWTSDKGRRRGLSCFYIGTNNNGSSEADRTTTNNYIYFDSPWHWGDSGNNYDFTWNEAQSGTSVPSSYSTTTTSASTTSTSEKGLSGHICIKNDNISFNNSGDYRNTAATYSFTTSGTVYFVGRNYDSGLHAVTSQNLNYITMVNYKPVYDLINSSTNKAKLADVDSYKEGGLLSLMQAYTEAQNFNPNDYDYSSSVPAAYGAGMQDVVDAFSAVSTTTDTAANYIALRDALDYSGEPTGIDGGDFDGTSFSVRDVIAANGNYNIVNGNIVLTSSGEKTLTGYSAFSTAYTNAVNVMAALGTAGYNTNNTSNYTDGANAASKATALMSAFNGLSAIDLNKPTVTAPNTYLGPSDAITVTDTNSGAATYKWQYSTDGGSSWTDGGNIAAAGGTFTPFSNATLATAGTVKIRVVATKSTATEYDDSAGVTYTYFTKPTMTIGGNAVSNNQIVTANTVVNFATTKAGASGTLQYSLNGGAWTAANSFTLFSGNTTTATLQVREVTAGGSTSELTDTYTFKRKPNAPTVTPDGHYLDASHGITVTSNDSSLDTDATIMVCSTENGTYVPFSNLATNGKYYPFANDTPSGASMQSDLYVKAVRNGAESETVHITYASLGWPTIINGNTIYSPNLNANDELTATDVISLETSTGEAGGTLKYAFSIDGGSTWSDAKTYSSAITPFAETVTIGGNSVNLANQVNVTMKAWEERDGSTSGENVVGPILLKQTTPLTVYYNADSEASTAVVTSADKYNSNGHFFINTNGYTGCAIYYQTKVDGGAWSGFTSYSINSGVDTDTYMSNKLVEIRFFVIQNSSKTVFAQGTFYRNDYNELVFKESFDDAAKTNSTTLTLSNSQGTATAANADSFSIEEGAGWKDNSNNSPDWRENVLKLNGSSTTDYGKLTFSNNPLNADAVTKYLAQQRGVTISLWRYVPAGDGDSNRGAANVSNWTSMLAFKQPNGDAYKRYYFHITQTGYVTRSDGAVDGNNDYNKYVDIKPNNNDNTGHATGSNRNRWVNIAVTVDPTSGVKVYFNGVYYPINVTAGTGGTQGNYTGNNAALAQDILAFLTDDNTTFTLADGEGYWSLDGKDLYLDDIRIYTSVKTQTDINNMYIEDDADIVTDFTSTSHDPTNVTVYTLARAVATDSNGTKPIGAKVGQEFIDYYGLDATNSADVSAIDEYSFGTGMTIYHRNKTTNKWEVIGDSEGRCGYQNEDLFGAEYHTALATPLAYAGTVSNTGAGHLVWAPHVMYNLTTDTWMYYGSTSSWGSQKSAIFLCENTTNDDITGPYTFRQDVYESNGHPNAIDACVYYTYNNDTKKPVKDDLNMVFGSWSTGTTCIVGYKLTANGRSYTGDRSYVCNPINNSLEGASDNTSGEGAYVVYENGYYYLYVSYGQNTGSYVERVFRSTSPLSGYVGYNGVSATDNSTHATHGNQILGPFDSSLYGYIMVSTGHNSVYKTVNNRGEVVSVNSTHARPNTNASYNWSPIQDNALATAQLDGGSSPNGNVNLVNQIAYTETGWPVIMPYQYDGSDTVIQDVTAEQLEGIYAANDMQTTEYYNWAQEYTYTIVADDDDETNTGAYEYGTDDAGDVFKGYIKLTQGTDGTNYATWYTSKEKYLEWIALDQSTRDSYLATWEAASPTDRSETKYCEYIEYIGVIGRHGNKVCIGEYCTYDFEFSWTFRTGDVPKSDEVDSLGDSVSMDGVIYTHLANDNFAKYGHEISDNFTYGQAGSTGERYTTITTTYPAKIDITNPGAVYCLSDEALCKTGEYSGGTFSVTALNSNKWYKASDTSVKYTDEEAAAAISAGTVTASELKRLYGLQGYVSDYYFDSSTGKYADSGVQLIVSYTDVTTGIAYSEFEFCYVAANPAMAHTLVAIRNKYNNTDTRGGLAIFSRMEGSYGTATNLQPTAYKVNATVNGSNGTVEYGGSGTFNYLYDFPNTSASISDSNYSGGDTIDSQFNKYTEKVGVNSGTYHLVEHYNQGLHGNDKRDDYGVYAAAANVTNADYYIDYSDDQNNLITYENGQPTGYALNFFASNIKWKFDGRVPNYDGLYNGTDWSLNVHRATSFVKNGTTLSMDTNVSPTLTHAYNAQASSNHYYYIATNTYVSGDENKSDFVGTISSGNQWLLNNLGTVSDSNYQTILKTMTTDGTADYSKLTPAFNRADSTISETAAWQGTLTLTGSKFKNVDKATGNNGDAAHNFAFEEGVKIKRNWLNGRGVTSEETFHYYNIGVSTCDKGAARAFAKKYLRKKLAVTDNGDGTVTVKRDNNGAPIFLDSSNHETNNADEADIINPSHYSLASYQEYIDAVAELNYFVKNPTNTMFKDYANSGSDASTKYITAYHDGEPYYVTNKTGSNIFGDSGASTDEVQAQLINNVITAYEDLFAVEDYTAAEDTYASIELLDGSSTPASASDVDTIKIYSDKEAGTVSATYSKDDYTADSWSAFVNLVMNVSSAFDYDSTKISGKDSWRQVELSGSEYRKLEDILDSANDTLLPAVNIATLTATHTAKSAVVAGGIYEAGVQTKTYASWADLKDECATAYNTYLDTSAGTYARTQTATIPGSQIVDGADNEPAFTYTQGQYAVTGVTRCKFDNVIFYARTVDTSTPSAEQALVNTENTTLSGKNLVNVDTNDAYNSYNSAYSVIDSLDMDMYTPAGVTLINNTKSDTDGVVYKTLNAAEATAYNTATGASVASGDKLKNTANGLTDAQTVALLSASGTVNDPANKATYIKKLKVRFTFDTDDDAKLDLGEGNIYGDTITSEDYYGEPKTFSIPTEAQTDYTVSNWSVTMYPGDSTSADPFGEENNSPIKPEGSQKVSGFDGFSLTRVITKNMAVYAQLVKNEAAESNNRYNIYDVYNKLIDVVYSDTELSEGDSTTEEILSGVTPKKMPFYTFSKWTVTKKADKVYDVKPTYVVDEAQQTYTFTIIDGTSTVTKTALYDKKVGIEYNGSGTFAAWAVRTGSAGNYKYQIASYSPSYNFYAVTSETYVALVSDGNGGYAPADDTAHSIKSADLEGQITNIGTNDADELVNNKIHDKVAFVSVEKTYMSADNKQARVYVRITEGAETNGTENFTSYGVLFVNGNVADEYKPTFVINGNIGGGTIYRRAVTNKVESGQFTYTLNNKNAFPNNVTFRAYVNYDYTYTVSATSSGMSDTTVTVNGTDYSNVLVATKNL